MHYPATTESQNSQHLHQQYPRNVDKKDHAYRQCEGIYLGAYETTPTSPPLMFA